MDKSMSNILNDKRNTIDSLSIAAARQTGAVYLAALVIQNTFSLIKWLALVYLTSHLNLPTEILKILTG